MSLLFLLLIAFQAPAQPIESLELRLLITDPDLRQELKLTVDQLATLRARSAADRRKQLVRRLRIPVEEFVALVRADAKRVMNDVLTPEQVTRFGQIQIQIRAINAFTMESVEATLALDEQQRARIRKLSDEMDGAVARIKEASELELKKLRKEAPDDREGYRAKMKASQQALEEQWTRSFRKAHAALTEEQKAKWKTLTGEPFEGVNRVGWRQVAMDRPGFSGR